MTTTVRLFQVLFGVALAAMFAVLAAPASHADHDVDAHRIPGSDRVDTAANIAEATFEAGDTPTALVARADDFPDALAGVGAAGAENAPVLLVEHDTVPPRTAEVLSDLEVERVIILGGEAAIAGAVESDLAATYDVERLEGEDRYETAAEIAAHLATTVGIGPMFGDTAALLVSGETFADAVTGGPLAYRGHLPILLTEHDHLPDATIAAIEDLDIERLLILGGTAAVSTAVENTVVAVTEVEVDRVAGERRTDTAAQLADMMVDTWEFRVTEPILATGADFPDALAAGPRGGELEVPVLLTRHANHIGHETANWLVARCPDVEVVQAVGGGAAITPYVLEGAVSAAEHCHAPQVVASHTTPLVPGQDRNINIHLAADYIDGSVIAPGQSFSLNAAIGPRTRERGFVPNGYIDEDGEVVSVVGGGVSQMATTFMNAAWAAGIDLVDFRQHTIYFERYPMCREATLAWDVLDVVVVNDSPYDIVVDTAYTSQSVTVSFISRPWASVDSWTGDPYDIEGPGGAFSVNCGRTIHYPDGTSTDESYFWRYHEGYPG